LPPRAHPCRSRLRQAALPAALLVASAAAALTPPPPPSAPASAPRLSSRALQKRKIGRDNFDFLLDERDKRVLKEEREKQ
jgi:hypothetical protein